MTASYEVVNLRKPRPSHAYWSKTPLTPHEQMELDTWTADWAEFNEALDRGDRVVVQVVEHNHKHQNSTAVVKQREVLGWGSDGDWRQTDGVSLTLGWDKRKNSLSVWSATGDVVWLRGHTGETVYDYDRQRGMVKAENVTLEDRTGRQIKVGDFCCYILHHFDRSGASIYFGTVTKFSKHGTTAYCKNIKLAEDDEVAEKRVTYSENIVVLTKDLLDRMMMARLALA